MTTCKRLLFIAAALSWFTPARADVAGTVSLTSLGTKPLSDGAWAASRSPGQRLESFNIQFANPPVAGATLEYQCDVHGSGTTAWLPQGTPCGTPGSGVDLEGFAVRFAANPASANYDVYYECHVAGLGDLGPFKNGASCGATGHQLQSMMVWWEPRGTSAIVGTVHLSGGGTSPFFSKGTTVPLVPDKLAGSRHPKAGQVDGFTMSINTPIAGVDMEYACQLGGVASTWLPQGTVCSAHNKPPGLRPIVYPPPPAVDGFAIRLTGKAASQYDVLYLCDSVGPGDTNILRNGAFCGTRSPTRPLAATAVWLKPVKPPPNPCNKITCSSNHISQPTCHNGVCDGACDVGWGDCNNNKQTDGCETAIDAIPNCGACGANCDDGNTCTNDLCTVSGGTGVCQHVSVLACSQGCQPISSCSYTDTDNDGLNDVWETNGYIDNNCNGVMEPGIDTPLPNADPNKPNVYVKFDYLVNSAPAPAGHSHQPSTTAMAMVQSAFAAHNVILTYYPSSDAITENKVVSLYSTAQHAALQAAGQCVGSDSTSLYSIKPAHFPSYLAPAWHYAVFAHYNTCDSIADCAQCPATARIPANIKFGTSGIGEMPGNDLIVSQGQLVDLGVSPIPDIVDAGTFMHELGHNIGLHHGGNDDLIQKPNYFSVMNYSYQFGMGTTATPGPFPTSTTDPSISYSIDYSNYTYGTLNEGTLQPGGTICVDDGSGGMNETTGLPSAPSTSALTTIFYTNSGGTSNYGPSNGSPIDWDGSPPPTDLHDFDDVSGDGQCSPLGGFDDWTSTTPSPGVTRFTNFSFSSQCNTGLWADGAVPVVSGPVREESLLLAKKRGLIRPFRDMEVRVRPACETRWVAPGVRGVIPVVAFGSAKFNVKEINPATLRFATVPPLKTTIADVNGDQIPDLIAEFPMASVALNGGSTHAALTGPTRDRVMFGGSDRVTVLTSLKPNLIEKTDRSGYNGTLEKADGSMVKLALSACASATDLCGGEINIDKAGRILRIQANEGSPKDMRIIGRSQFELRGAFDRKGDGRVYTLTYEVSDGAGHTVEAECRLQVQPGDHPAVDTQPKACVGDCPRLPTKKH
jgi:hypothetical protein